MSCQIRPQQLKWQYAKGYVGSTKILHSSEELLGLFLFLK